MTEHNLNAAFKFHVEELVQSESGLVHTEHSCTLHIMQMHAHDHML